MARQINTAGLELIKQSEGLKLAVYKDSAGYDTIGFGHRILPGEEIPVVITQDEAEDLLIKDLTDAENDVTNFIHVPLNDNQFSALVSLVYNEGVRPLTGTLGAMLNANDYENAAQQFLRWIFVDGDVSAGLQGRRQAEKELFQS